MTGDSRLHFGVLGSFRVDRDGQEVDLGPRLQRTLLAILVVDAGHVVPVDRLIDLLWRDEPAGGGDRVGAGVCLAAAPGARARPALPGRPPGCWSPRIPGTCCASTTSQVDALRFQALARQAHDDLAAGQPAAAAAGLEDALALWQGEPLAEFADRAVGGARGDPAHRGA